MVKLIITMLKQTMQKKVDDAGMFHKQPCCPYNIIS